MRKIKWIIIHHTATSWTTSLESIRRYHVEELGWSDIGYHYLISPKTIRLGRPEWRMGAHCKGRNQSSLGIALIGNYEKCRLMMSEGNQLELLIADLLHRYPGAKVRGHKDFANTLCPGKWLYKWLEDGGYFND